MIVRPFGSDLLLITQPDHAALAARLMTAWRAHGFPARTSRARVLEATRLHDLGWEPIDAAPEVDPESGLPYDFTNAPADVRRPLWFRALDQLAPRDPYIAALVAQHALTVYRRFASAPGWETFFPPLEQRRDDLFADIFAAAAAPRPEGADPAAAPPALDLFLQDYVIVGLGDLFSLIFCNGWTDPYLQEDYQAILLPDAPTGETTARPARNAGVRADAGADVEVVDGGRLVLSPDPFDGAEVRLEVRARRLPARRYVSDEDLRASVARAPVVHLAGIAAGAPVLPIP